MKRLLLICLIWVIPGAVAQDSRPAPSSRPAATRPAKPKLQCGHYAVRHCCQLLGVPADMGAILELLPPKVDGHSMLELAAALEHLGLGIQGRMESYDSMCGGGFPIIVHMGGDHFVVVERANDQFVMLLDGDGRRKLSRTESFRQQWDGTLLRVKRADRNRPLPNFEKAETARIQFDFLFLDKGEIAYDAQSVPYEFPFRNLGTADLVIKRIRTTCSCLQTQKPEKPLAPGESGKLVLNYRPTQGSAFMQQAFVETNDACTPVVELTAAGNTARVMIVDPPSLDFHKVILGESTVASCVVRYSGDTLLTVDDLKCTLDGSSISQHVVADSEVQWLKERRIFTNDLSDHSTIISVRWTAQGPIGSTTKGALKFRTNVNGFEQVSVPVQAEVMAPVVLTPSACLLNIPNQNTSVESQVSLISRNGAPFRIVGVDAKGTGLECMYSKALNGNQAEIRFSGRPKTLSSSGELKLGIVVEMAAGQKFDLPFSIYMEGQSGSESKPN